VHSKIARVAFAGCNQCLITPLLTDDDISATFVEKSRRYKFLLWWTIIWWKHWACQVNWTVDWRTYSAKAKI